MSGKPIVSTVNPNKILSDFKRLADEDYPAYVKLSNALKMWEKRNFNGGFK